MQIENVTYHNVTQGSDDWHALRRGRYTASQAAAALGRHKYQSRDDLIRRLAGYDDEDDGNGKDWIYRRGHAAENAARPVVEARTGEDLYPATVTAEIDGLPMMASVDGVDLLGDLVWENKLPSAELRDQVARGELEDHYLDQLNQAMLLTGATRALFTATDGSEDDWHELEVHADPERQRAIVEAWKRAAEDAKTYQPAEPEVIGKTPDTLPTVRLNASEVAVESNLAEVRAHADAVFAAIKTEPETDEDFADAEKTIKWCEDVEARLQSAREAALSQTADLDEALRTLDSIREDARDARLKLKRAVDQRKQALKDQAVREAQIAVAEYVDDWNAALGLDIGVPDRQEIAQAAKGKKTLRTYQQAARDAAARLIAQVDDWGHQVRGRLEVFQEAAGDRLELFPDRDALVLANEPDALRALVRQRIEDADQRKAERQDEAERQAEAQQAAAAKRQEDAERHKILEDLDRQEKHRDEAAQGDEVPDEGPVGMGQDAARDTGPIPRTLDELGSAAEEGRPVKVNVFLDAPAGWTDEQIRQEVERRLSDLRPSVAVRRREDAA